ncbi:hypothetical protein [Brevundimonas sp.]|jgi:hypothetical protein|uniref:hypothetical protein n=1 Tax=Brevundimonas sp. TaxID=1871086 RepID=UPI0037833D43
MTDRYIAIGGGYFYAPLRAGVSLRAPNGREVYFQPGDDEATFYETLEALGEVQDDRRDMAVDLAFGEYFA